MYAYGKVFQFQQMSSQQAQPDQSQTQHPPTTQSLDRANDGVH